MSNHPNGPLPEGSPLTLGALLYWIRVGGAPWAWALGPSRLGLGF
jgi:hypothetical protein